MIKISETITFFGSGPVAARSLELLAQDFDIEAVITKPRAPHHKGDVPVLNLAKKLNLPIFTASTKQELNDLFTSKPVKSRLAVLIDFGIIVSQEVIDYFPLGIINSHFSVLPEWRGADPITFSILSGQSKAGVSLMLIDEKMDTGKLIAQKSMTIKSGANTPNLTKELIDLSHALLATYLPLYMTDQVKPRAQSHPNRATYSRKLTKDDGIIDWNKSAEQIEREIRAYIEWPKSRTTLGDKEIIITQASIVDEDNKPGQIELKGKDIIIYTGNKALKIERLKPAGKNDMSAQEFLAGNKI